LTDEDYMRLALECARLGEGRTSPNPLVGAVIVREGRVVATGWHRAPGTPHAEIHALNMAGDLAEGATLYVTLEPCAHFGRTAPCVEAIIKAKIARVVFAAIDPNPLVAGKGAARLKEAGLSVSCGVLKSAAEKLNEIFFTWIKEKRPFTVLKSAMTLDGKIAAASGKSQWITGEAARRKGHEWRNLYDGIMVGINTVLNDDPSLTTRLNGGYGRNPRRIIVDSSAKIPLTARVLTDDAAPTIIAVTAKALPEKIAALRAVGAKVIVSGEGETVDLPLLMQELAKEEICSLLVEGGGTLNFSLLKEGLIDKVHIFVAPKFLGGRFALTPLAGKGFDDPNTAPKLNDLSVVPVGEDFLFTGYVER